MKKQNMKKRICIKNGIVYDPLNGINGEKMDIFIDGCHIDNELNELSDVEVLDVNGCAVMPAGVDVHSHVATYGLNFARYIFNFPTVSAAGLTYAMMGYSHVNEPLMTIDTASYVHHELSSIPFVDVSALLAVSLREVANEIREGDHETVRGVFRRLAEITKAIGIKIYDKSVSYEKKGYFYREIDMETCIQFLKSVSQNDVPCDYEIDDNEMRIVMKNIPIYMRTSEDLLRDVPLDVLKAFRLSHISSGITDDETYERAFKFLRDGGFADIGISIPHDGPRITDAAGSGVFIDIGFDKPLIFSAAETEKKSEMKKEMEVSVRLAMEAHAFNNIVFSTDSPNGCIFADYPKVFAALMDRNMRKDVFGDAIISDYEYSLFDIARVRSANAARFLCLDMKGHMGAGAIADIAIYEINENTKGHEIERKLRKCKFLLKNGDFVIYNAELAAHPNCRTIYADFLKRDNKKDGQKDGQNNEKNKNNKMKDKDNKEEDKVERVLRRICDSRSFRREHIRVDKIFTSR